jgi:hypothetical protein
VIHNPVLCLQTLCDLEDGLDDDGRKPSPELALVDGEATPPPRWAFGFCIKQIRLTLVDCALRGNL